MPSLSHVAARAGTLPAPKSARAHWAVFATVLMVTLLVGCEGASQSARVARGFPATPTESYGPLISPIAPPREPELPAPKQAYYVSNAGDDDNDGRSAATPWRTLARAAVQPLEPGDHVLLERGSLFREMLEVTASGQPELPIVYSAYGDGPDPVVSGADLVAGWQQGAGGSYWAPLAVAPSRVWIDGEELSRVGAPTDLSDGQFAFQDSRLYVRLRGGASPEGLTVEAAQRPAAVRDSVGHSYVMISDLVGEKSNGASKYDGVFNARANSDHWTLYNVKARDGAGNGFFAEQSASSGIGSYLLLMNSEAANNASRGAVAAGAWNLDQVFYGLHSHHNGKDGILINSHGGRLTASRLEQNGARSAPDHGFYIYPWKDGGANWVIMDNVMTGNRTSGGRIAGSGHLIAGNVVAGNPYGFLVVDNDGPNNDHVIEDNVIFGTDPRAYAVELEGTIGVVVRNNMLVESAGIGIVQGTLRGNENLLIIGNRFGGDSSQAFVYAQPTQAGGFVAKDNCFDAGLHVEDALQELDRRRQAREDGNRTDSQAAASEPSVDSASLSVLGACG